MLPEALPIDCIMTEVGMELGYRHLGGTLLLKPLMAVEQLMTRTQVFVEKSNTWRL